MQDKQHDNLPVVDGNEVLESEKEVQDSRNEAIETIENLNAEVSEDVTIGESMIFRCRIMMQWIWRV